LFGLVAGRLPSWEALAHRWNTHVMESYADPAESMFAPLEMSIIFTPQDPLPPHLMTELVQHIDSLCPGVLRQPSLLWKDLDLFRWIYSEAVQLTVGLLQSL